MRAPASDRITYLSRCLLTVCLCCAALVAQAASRRPVMAEQGMVVTAQHLATEVGVEILKRGGNAVDAAVAVGYAMAVVYPAAGNLGGGGFMTLQLADGRKAFLDFRETAPLAAKADMYLDEAGKVRPGLSTLGHLAVGVPGTVAGLEMARMRYGSLPRAVLIEPAIRLAEQGFVLDEGDVAMLRQASADLAKDPASAAIFLKQGRLYQAGESIVQKDLATTLRHIRDKGVDGFYKGPVAAALVASNRAGHGILTQADLDAYKAQERQPVQCDYRGYGIVSAPPPSSGGVVICEILQILEGYPLAQWGFRSAQAVHVQIEAMRHAYVDRNSYLGDPAFVRNPLERLLDKGYATQIRAAIDPARAAVSTELKPGVPPHEGHHTTHYSIADRFGNAVAVTYTLNEWFGARVTAAGTGVLLNNEMDDFTIKPGEANLYGLVQGAANAIAPGKRPLSSMSPTIVTRNGKPVLVLGTPGGSRIITTVVHTLVNMIDYGMDVQEAVDAPRFHQQWLPDLTYAEPFAIPPDARRMLEGMGHHFGGPQPPNHVAAIAIGAPRLGPASADGDRSKGHSTLDGTPEIAPETAPVRKARFYGAIDPRYPTGLAMGY